MCWLDRFVEFTLKHSLYTWLKFGSGADFIEGLERKTGVNKLVPNWASSRVRMGLI